MRAYIFPTIVMIAALALAGGAAMFTILGFREVFEASIKITLMAGSIEIGKIVAVSALHQFKDVMNWWWKIVMILLIAVAMAVTSMGVYGYLSSSYQKSTMGLAQNTATLKLLDKSRALLQSRLAGMDDQIANVPQAYVSKRMELIRTFKVERDDILLSMKELDTKKLELELEKIDGETEFGAIILLAKSVDWLDESKAMLYFILAIIFIFDPMAIALTYIANIGFSTASTKKQVIPKVDDIAPTPDNNDVLLSQLDNINTAITTLCDDNTARRARFDVLDT